MCPQGHAPPASGQPFFLDIIHHLAQVAKDPDADYTHHLVEGVPLGVEEHTLQSPDIWPSKDEMSGTFWEPGDPMPLSGRDNYKSALAHVDTIDSTFLEEKMLGMVDGPFTAQEAADICQCTIMELCPGPLGAVEELDKVRTIYDGSIGHQNDHIRMHTLEKTTSPTVSDLVAARHWLDWVSTSTGTFGPERKHAAQQPNKWFPPHKEDWCILKADISKAHRRIKVLPPGWKYQVAINNGKYWINKVGTYGMASAQLYWGRMAALLLRILYYMFPLVDWQFVYVDDFAWLLRKETASSTSMAILGTLIALGVPLSWKKTELNSTVRWLGFLIDANSIKLSIPDDKLEMLDRALHLIEDGAPHSATDVQKLVGRLQWASAAWPMTRPWLQPFWAWMVALKGKGRPGKLVRMVATTLRHIFKLDCYLTSPYKTADPLYGATDAGADDSTATVGGWFSHLESPKKSEVWWFMEQMKVEHHPWAFDKGPPQRRISSLELYGSVVLTKLILSKLAQKPAIIPIFTDNQGNALALLSSRSKRWPNSAMIMDLVVTLHLAGSSIRPSFVKREFNTWADQLTHMNSSGFSTDKQLLPPPMSTWPAFPALLQAYGEDSTTPTGTFGPERVKRRGTAPRA